MTEANPGGGEALAEYRKTLKAMRAEAGEADKPGLDLALFAIGDEGADMGGFEDEFASDEDMMAEIPPEPTRKAVAGSAAGGATLLLAWVLSEIGVQMPVEVQAAVAVLVGAGVAYFKKEF